MTGLSEDSTMTRLLPVGSTAAESLPAVRPSQRARQEDRRVTVDPGWGRVWDGGGCGPCVLPGQDGAGAVPLGGGRTAAGVSALRVDPGGTNRWQLATEWRGGSRRPGGVGLGRRAGLLRL